MPHIHTQPDQHDMTVSAYIVRRVDDEWKCLVHYHKKMDVLMQIGGHIELNETPWQTMAHELAEESGYTLAELDIVQCTSDRIAETDNVSHPTPFAMNTHLVGNEHFHSDTCYGFVAEAEPCTIVAEGESQDLRWLTLAELHEGVSRGDVLKDVAAIYDFLLAHIDTWVRVPAESFSVDKPHVAGVTYKRGAAGEVS